MTRKELDFLLKLEGLHKPNGISEYGFLRPIEYSINYLRRCLSDSSQFDSLGKFTYKNSSHDNCLNIDNIIDHLRSVQRSLYETIEFVENFKRKNFND